MEVLPWGSLGSIGGLWWAILSDLDASLLLLDAFLEGSNPSKGVPSRFKGRGSRRGPDAFLALKSRSLPLGLPTMK
eukprot:7128247-Pyramimonas_sp.AAC.1